MFQQYFKGHWQTIKFYQFQLTSEYFLKLSKFDDDDLFNPGLFTYNVRREMCEAAHFEAEWGEGENPHSAQCAVC